MDHFVLRSKYQPTGDQPQAIEKLVKGFKDSREKRLARIRAAKEAKEKKVYKQRVVQQI